MIDVLIVGGGPVGVFLACELTLAGAHPVVLERLPGISQGDKAHGLTGQVVRLLDHRGLFERLGGTGAPVPAPGFFFGALPLPLSVLGEDNPMYLLPVNQRDLERVIGERAAELGVDVRRGYDVQSFTQADDHVDVVALDDHGVETTLRAAFVVGCDGARSVVRKLSAISFPGTTDEQIVDRSALVAATDQLRPTPDGQVVVEGLGPVRATFHRTERGVFTVAHWDPERPLVYTMEWEDQPVGSSPGTGPVMTLTEMEDSIERVLGVRVSLAPPPPGPTLLRRLCGRNTRVADRYRDRRVFLAGDAAHVHAAAGGPGLNLALQDAANLAWKLAAELQGWASPGLLDTYESERHPFGRRVFMQTQAQTALMAPGADVTAVRELFSELLTRRETVQQIADLMAGADVRLDMGDEDPAAATGWFAPDLDLTTPDGRSHRLPELGHGARPLLLDLSGGTELAAVAAAWSDRVDRVPARAGTARDDALLIRPDGYVAWAGVDPDALRAALNRWFGPVHDQRAA